MNVALAFPKKTEQDTVAAAKSAVMPKRGGKPKAKVKAKHVARGQLGRMLIKSKAKAAKTRATARANGEM